MIEFACPHCQNSLKVADDLAGRDGWCRVCKRWIVIPMGSGKGSPMDSMTVEEKYERLEHMLQYAATKADSLKGLLSKYCDENGNMIPADTARFRREKRDKFENRLKRSEQDVREMRDTVKNARQERDEAIAERDRLQEKLQGHGAQIEDHATDLEAHDFASVETDARLAKLQDELDVVRVARDTDRSDREDLTDRIIRLEEELGGKRDEVRALSEESETFQRKIESMSESDSALRQDGEELAKELAEVREEADRLRDELDVVKKSAWNGDAALSPVAAPSAPLSVEGQLVSRPGDLLMDSYLRFLESKPATNGESFDE